MKERFSLRLARASKSLLKSQVGSRASSLLYVAIVMLLCLTFSVFGYLRRDGAKVQFVRATANTGLSYEDQDVKPTSLEIRHLHFDPRRNDPDPERRCRPGPLFDSLDSAEVDSIKIQWGWSFLPTPTAIAFTGVRPVITTGKLQATIDWLSHLPKGTARTFAIDIQDCRPVLSDVLDDLGRPVETPPFRLTVGPEVNGDFAANLVMAESAKTGSTSFRINWDGHGALYFNGSNCNLHAATWQWLRDMLTRNAASRAWWYNVTGFSDTLRDWVNTHDLTGNFNYTAAAFFEKDEKGSHLRQLDADAAATDLTYQPLLAPDGALQRIDLKGTLAAHAHYDHGRGSFQVDLGAGNHLDLNFDKPEPASGGVSHNGAGPVEMFWEGWLERNQSITGFQLAGSYRYRKDLEDPAKPWPVWVQKLSPWVRQAVIDSFGFTQLEGAELRTDLADGAELRLFIGQPEWQQYKASIGVRAPRTGKSQGAWAQADFALVPSANPGVAAPITFDMTVYTDKFPVPGFPNTFYTGKFNLTKGSITRAWIDKLLLQRDLNVSFTALPWLDVLNRQESLTFDLRVLDGRFQDLGDHPYFVRNGNLNGVVTFKSLNPFNGSFAIREITGAQTGFGEHIVEFGPQRLTGQMDFNLGYITRDGFVDAWQNHAVDPDPDNLFAVHLLSNAKNEPAWEFHFVLPWNMTRARPGSMQALHFPAKLFPPGLNHPDSTLVMDVPAPIDWQISCWLEPSNVGEAALSGASLCQMPDTNAAAGARMAQALGFSGLPGRRVLIVKRSLSAPNITIKTADDFEMDGLSLPGVGDTKCYRFPPE